MCEFCKYCLLYGDEVECIILERTPSYEEFKNCKNFEMHDELKKIYENELKN